MMCKLLHSWLILTTAIAATAVVGCVSPDSGVEPSPPGSGGFDGTGGFTGVGGGFDGPFTGVGGNQSGCDLPGAGASAGVSAPSPRAGGATFGGTFQPQLGATVTPSVPPPAISGGTLRVLRDGHTAIAADPDRDRITVVDLKTAKIVATISLQTGDEPGRVIEDAAGRVHVALRRGGALATLDPASWASLTRRSVCAAPRGLAYEAKTDLVHVACADGQLISLPAAGGVATRTIKLDRDLRDVVVDGDRLLVSRFRSAQVLTLDAAGTVTQRLTPAPFRSGDAHQNSLFSASVAWRMVEMPGGGAAMVHQRGMDDMVMTQFGQGYGSTNACDAIVQTAVTVMKSGQTPTASPAIPGMVLPVDLAVSADGKRVAVIAAGNATNATQFGQPPALPRVFVTDLDAVDSVKADGIGCRSDGWHGPCLASPFLKSDVVTSPGVSGVGGATGTICAPGMLCGVGGGGAVGAGGPAGVPGSTVDCSSPVPTPGIPEIVGEPIAVAFDATGMVVVQAREPAALFLGSGARVTLSSDSRVDTGHAIFHGNAGAFVACASCHAEGAEDGRVWSFSCEGDRRTQSLNEGISGTEPFHWNGDMTTFGQLMDTVFMGRMSGPKLAPEQLEATLGWIDRQPHPASMPAVDPAAAERGRVLFNDNTRAACATCHAGPKLTNNMSSDVGTGGIFQVPSLLGVGARLPVMHNGCAKTLADRFNAPACGGGDKHGVTSMLSPPQLADLTTFLETL